MTFCTIFMKLLSFRKKILIAKYGKKTTKNQLFTNINQRVAEQPARIFIDLKMVHYDAKLCFLCIVHGFRNQNAHLFFFCSLLSFDRYVKILPCLKTCLWNPGTYRHKIVRLSRSQFGLVMSKFHCLCFFFTAVPGAEKLSTSSF